MLKMYAYNNGSKGARLLAEAMGIKMLKHQGSLWRPKRKDWVVNWGASDIPILYFPNVLNIPEAVNCAKNKLTSFRMFEAAGVSIPPFTTDPEEAAKMMGKVVVRHKLYGQGGDGIEVVDFGTKPFPIAPLYTMYIKKKGEYRVHVFQDKVIDVQQKKRKKDAPVGDGIVRNLDNGYVYCRNGIVVPDKVKEEAVKAVNALGLDFGGVDVIYNEHYRTAYVLEVNTAPGIEGTTVDKYKEVFSKYNE